MKQISYRRLVNRIRKQLHTVALPVVLKLSLRGIRFQSRAQVLAERSPITNATTCRVLRQRATQGHRLFDRLQAQVLPFVELKDIVLIGRLEPIGY